MSFSLLKHYLDTDTALKVSQSLYCFTTSISHSVENYFPRLWGTGISDAIFFLFLSASRQPYVLKDRMLLYLYKMITLPFDYTCVLLGCL